MKLNKEWQVRLAQTLLGAAIVLSLVVVRGTNAGNPPVPLATDWSHRHLVFSAPMSLAHHVHLLSRPRYVQQLVRRNAGTMGVSDEWRWRRAPEGSDTLPGDWSEDMGAGATAGAGTYPAKFSFNVGMVNCITPAPPAGQQPDFVAYNTSVSSTAATRVGTFSSEPATGSTITITNGTNTLTMTAGAANANTGTGTGTYSRNANTTTIATHLTTALNIAGNGSYVGITATSSTDTVTITAIHGGTAGNSIALASSSASFTWAGATLTGGLDNQASIIAYGNLYATTCTGTVPTTYWAYNTGGKILTSVVLSADGKQVAFVQTLGDGNAYFTMLKWAAGGGGTASAPRDPATVTNANYRTCTAPCMTTIVLNGDHNDTSSSPFYDYALGSDSIYVGDDSGVLHKFTNVFVSGTPAETMANGWPVTVSAGNKLTSPVYDEGATVPTSYVYVGDSARVFHYVAQTTATTTTLVSSGTLAAAGDGIDDAPVVDASTGKVYVFVRGDNTAGAGRRAQVVQLPSGFAAGSTGASAGASAASVSSNNTLPATAFFAGSFDNTYYNSVNGTGHMYVCGTNGGLTALWQITVTAGALGTATAGPTLTTANVECSPVVEFNNGSTDRIFLSVTNDAVTGGVIGCGTATGCIMSFNVTAGTVPSTTSAHALEAGGTSGIIVDGSSGSAGASQVYFTPLANQTCTTSGGTGGCAIQASQSGLN